MDEAILPGAKVAVIVQARMGSTRLPGKALKQIAGVPLTARVLSRVARFCADADDGIVLAVPRGDEEALARALDDVGAPVVFWEGSESDVLGRFYDAACAAMADAVVRVTGDCPLVDADVIEACVEQFLDGGADYLSTSHPERTLPSGFDVEVFSRDALTRAHFDCSAPAGREHVTSHLYGGCTLNSRFRCATYRPDPPCPPEWLKLNLAVDTAEDLARVERVLAVVGEGGTWREYAAAAAAEG